MKIPVVEMGECVRCGVCQEVCPRVFKLNDLNYIEVIDMDIYPEAEVDEAIKTCPEHCISWSL
ncbi:MAG: ferredoxin [Desulfobacterales bacterium]|nr:ferredoxin [Desulfobacterales bacterium]MBF0397641.1 ferredoxin [Desulfobacterales bacterium]